MYSTKDNVNTLTALLIAHDIKHAVVCPGSRNAPIVNNLAVCGEITCHPVTDERSAAFFALGISLATNEKVAVCVTSGSALLNTAPAVAEAYYQGVPLLVISADRPAAWIDQNDGQTIRQHEALKQFVKHSVTLPIVHNDEQRWHCNRMVNEAILACNHHGRGPVHINIEIDEPLYDFSTPSLPEERVIRRYSAECLNDVSTLPLMESYCDAQRPMIVVGQAGLSEVPEYIVDELSRHCVIISEPLGVGYLATPFDDALSIIGNDKEYMPDLIVYVGGMVVSKRLKQFLRRCTSAEQWRIGNDSTIIDTFAHITGVVEAEAEHILHYMAFSAHLKKNSFAQRWNEMIKAVEEEQHTKHTLTAATEENEGTSNAEGFSSEEAVKYIEMKAAKMRENIHFHYANSTSVRLACRYARHRVFCNRGVNGIEGSLSTAAGFSVATKEMVVCITGDLSFFYDANALWNNQLGGNLRILLLNNGGGDIFKHLPGFASDAIASPFIAGNHSTSAQGICKAYNAEYVLARNTTEMRQAIDTLLTATSDRPVVAEIMLG